MITNIKVEQIMVGSGVLGAKIYEPMDITSRVELPIIDTTQLDSVLDTTVLSYQSTISTPLKPLTRIKITLTDTVDGVSTNEYIYRLVDNDIVEKVVLGGQSMYRHTLSLIEITKQLERETVDNLTFTNYLEDNYGTDNIIKFNVISATHLTGLESFNNYFWNAKFLTPYTYNSFSNKFVGPYKLLYKSGYELFSSTTPNVLEVVADDIDPTIFDANTQIKISDVTPTDAHITVGDYVKYINHSSDNTISTNISLNIVILYQTSLIDVWSSSWKRDSLKLKEFWVEKPNSTRENLTLNSNFTFNDVGVYNFYQKYKLIDSESNTGLHNGVELANVLVKWTISVVNNLALVPQKYSVKDIVQRLINIYKLRRNELDYPDYKLDESIADKLDKIPSPEFSFTQGTLFEALQQIGEYIHAIPRLIPDVFYEEDYDTDNNVVNIRNDYTDWNIITFDFLGGNDLYSCDNTTIEQGEHPLEEFANNFVSNVQNATQSNYTGMCTVIEPFMGGFLSTRTENATFEISNDNCIFRTQKPIRSLISVKVYSKGVIKDITGNVVEKSRYDLLYSYTNPSDVYNNKAFYLYYTKGEKNIYALEYLRQNQNGLSVFNNNQAVKNILNLDAEIDVEEFIKDLAVQIEYIPFQNFKVKQYKEQLDVTEPNSTLFFNQQANSVDVDSFGENMKGAILKTGNRKIVKTQYYDSIENAPHCGVVTNDGYYAFVVNRELVLNAPIKVTTQWSYQYNELNAFTSLKKSIRQYEISEEESVNRNVDYQEFCVIDNKLDVQDFINDNELVNIQNYIVNELSSIGFGTNTMLNIFSNKLKNSMNVNKQITYAVIKTIGVDRAGQEERHCFLLPVACFPFGNSIVLHTTTDDNYSAATYSEDPNNVSDIATSLALNSYNIEEYVKYSNEFGRFDTMSVGYGCDNPLINFSNNIKSNSKKLYKVDENNINTNSILIDYYTSNPFIVDKDSREQISLTTQLNFVTINKDCIIGKGLSSTMPIVGDTSATFSVVIFKLKPSRYDEFINEVDIVRVGTPVITDINTDYKYFKIDPIISLTNGVGFGIIDNRNRLVVYFSKTIQIDEYTDPIYFMFRKYK